MKKWIIVIVIIIFSLVVFWFTSKPIEQIPQQKTGEKETVSLQTGPHPWGPESNSLRNRLKAINIPTLSEEGTLLHTHQHLDIFILGEKIEIPNGIGVNEPEKFISPIHTHDNLGIIHIESPTIEKYNLGQFFDIWGVRFDDQCLGGYCQENDKQLFVFVNGQEVEQNFRDILLENSQEIVIVYGTSENIPQPIPASYTFPPDY